MDSEVISGIAVAAIGTIGLIIVAFVNRGGKKVGSTEVPFVPSDHSEHGRTRDAIHSMRREMHLRFDAQDAAKGTVRQQEQVEVSGQRVIDGEDTNKG